MPLILVLYVENLFMIDSEPLMIECKGELAFEFEMNDLGLILCFLSLEVWKRPNEIFLSRGKYAVMLLDIFGMQVTSHTDGNEFQEFMWRSSKTRFSKSIRV